MREIEVTRRVKEYLTDNLWTMIAVHYPGSQAGMYVHDSNRKGKGSKGSVVIDIVAERDTDFLLIESKSRFEMFDVDKLVKVTTSPNYRGSLNERLRTDRFKSFRILRGIAVAQINLETLRFPYEFLVFKVGTRGIGIYGTYSGTSLSGIFPSYATLWEV